MGAPKYKQIDSTVRCNSTCFEIAPATLGKVFFTMLLPTDFFGLSVFFDDYLSGVVEYAGIQRGISKEQRHLGQQ